MRYSSPRVWPHLAPNHLRDEPGVLILGRLLPFGFHAVNITAAATSVSPRRQTLTSAVSNIIYALIASAAGAGIIEFLE